MFFYVSGDYPILHMGSYESILLIKQKGIKSSLFDGFVTPPSTVEYVLNRKISKTARNP
jgi:hypothetical protein